MGQSTKTRANCSKMAEPNRSDSSSNEDIPRPLDMSKSQVNEENLFEEHGCKFCRNELMEQDPISRRGKFLPISNDDGIFQAHTDVRLDADFWNFELKVEMALLNAAMLAKADNARAES
ncbi:MAG: hypothetical protein EZS28_042085, partial [Streblomastix strix]